MIREREREREREKNLRVGFLFLLVHYKKPRYNRAAPRASAQEALERAPFHGGDDRAEYDARDLPDKTLFVGDFSFRSGRSWAGVFFFFFV